MGRLGRAAIVVVSVLVHAGALLALVSLQPTPPKLAESEAIQVSFVTLPKPPPPKPPAPTPTPTVPEPSPAPKKPLPKRSFARPTPRPPPATVEAIPAGKAKIIQSGVEMSDAEVAGAATAGSGSGGGQCDVAGWLQTGLRRDRHVQSALTRLPMEASGKAFLLWRDDWVRSQGEEGEGLAVIREAVMMEILSAPEVCRTQTMHGLVIVSPSAGAGGVRLGVGAGTWRWADLLLPRGGIAGHGGGR